MVKKLENYKNKCKFVLDENVPKSSVEMLKSKGFEVEHISLTELQGEEDGKIAEYAKNKKAILITKDKNFGNPLRYSKSSHYGLIIIRLHYSFNVIQKTNTLKSLIDEIEPNKLINYITILELGKYRRIKPS